MSFKETTHRQIKKKEREKEKNTDRTQTKLSASHVRCIMTWEKNILDSNFNGKVFGVVSRF